MLSSNSRASSFVELRRQGDAGFPVRHRQHSSLADARLAGNSAALSAFNARADMAHDQHQCADRRHGPLYGRLLGQDLGSYYPYLAIGYVVWIFISTTMMNDAC